MPLRFLAKLTKFWPILLLVGIELVLLGVNVTPNTYLMGWDNVMPEFNFRQALITNIFGAWQEHRGLGLPDGMGHAANLVHTLFLWLLSAVVPQNLLRYIFQFLMHLAGMVGMYLLLNELALKTKSFKVMGSLFYGLNLITIQMFYTPLEAFSVHFAALPWLAYALIRYLKKGDRNTLFLFSTVSFLVTPQFFIPTLMLPTAILLATLALSQLRQWKRILTAMMMFACINAFWLMPYLYNLPHNAPVIANAKINQMSSSEVYVRNQAFGDLKNVWLMRGFMLDFEDIAADGQPIYVMESWRTFTSLPAIQALEGLFTALALLGLVTSLWRRKQGYAAAFAVTGGVAFILLANNTPVITSLLSYLRTMAPIFAEAYRFPFTKFGLLYGFTMSIFVVLGLQFIVDTLLKSKLSFELGATFLFMAAIAANALPAFTGHFFYQELKVSLPQNYIALFRYLDKQDHNGRTAYLPQPSYWSWKHYRWGYVGSGFLWYGIAQPLLDRAFDPWSNQNENYYWELSYAIYKKDAPLLHSVLAKYDVRYLILDRYVLAPGNDRSLFVEDTNTLLLAAGVQKRQDFGDITVYENDASPSIIQVSGNLPRVAPYSWNDNDIAYQQLGNYQSASIPTITYPFRSLFTKRTIDEREFRIIPQNEALTIYPADRQYDQYAVTIDTKYPVFSTTDMSLLQSAVKPCGVLKQGSTEAIYLDKILRIRAINQRACLSFGIETASHTQSYLVAVTSRHIGGRPLMFSLISNTAKHVELETLLESQTADWHTDYFVLPPLAYDGLGYTVYFTNEGMNMASTNDIANISFYTLPYQEMTTLTIDPKGYVATPAYAPATSHPNPSLYGAKIRPAQIATTLILAQGFDPGWHAYDTTKCHQNLMCTWLPYLFGTRLPHLMVNNWKNAWSLPTGTSEVVMIYIPQLLEYVGFVLLSLPVISLLRRKLH